MYDKCYFCLDQLPKLKKESTASFFVNFGGAGVQKSRPTLLYTIIYAKQWNICTKKGESECALKMMKRPYKIISPQNYP